jgi:hypothetical protein
MPPRRKRFKSSTEKHADKKPLDDYPTIRRRPILTRKPRLGGSYEQTVAMDHSEAYDANGVLTETVDPKAIQHLKDLHKGEVKSRFYSPKARSEHHFETVTLQNPKIRAWFEDPTIKQVLKDHVELLYHAVLQHIRGRRPEYLMTVMLDIIYYTHSEWFEPASFVDDFNPLTYFNNYYFVWDIIREKGLKTFKTPGGVIELKMRKIQSPKK